MLNLSQYRQLSTLNELKSHTTTKFVIIPDDLKAKISYKTLLSESTWSDVKSKITRMSIFRDLSCYYSSLDELDLIDADTIHNVIMIDHDRGDDEEYLITFENAKALNEFEESERPICKNSVYLVLDDEMVEYLEAETLKAQIELCDEKIAKAKRDIELANKALKEFQDLKSTFVNDL